MSVITLHVGPFAAVYVGLASGSDVLTQLTGITTAAQHVQMTQPETFNYSQLNTLQSGPVSISADLTFLSDDPQAIILATGNFLDTVNQDSPSNDVKLTLLLIHPDQAAESSILIPTCTVNKTIKLNLEKSNPTVTPLTFQWQQLNRYTPQIYYKRSVAELATILGSRSPV